jgi:HD-GYP domain-containing protein (c-di-GMP phosphodiesterase class II)
VNFLKVKSDFLEVDKTLNYHLFLYDNTRKKRFVALYAGSPIIEEVFNDFQEIEEKGGYLQINKKTVDSFCRDFDIEKDEIIALNEDYYKWYFLYENRLEQYEESIKDPFPFKKELMHAIAMDKFDKLIERFYAEIMTFPLHITQEISTATTLVEKLGKKDSPLHRKLALGHFIAQEVRIADHEALALLALATMLKDSGRTLLSFSHKKEKEQDLIRDDAFRKHPMLSYYLLSKAPIEWDKRLLRLILEHHELIDGSGFPRGKKEDYIDLISQLVQVADLIVEHGDKVDKKDYYQIIRRIVNQTNVGGTPHAFSKNIRDVLETLLPKD